MTNRDAFRYPLFSIIDGSVELDIERNEILQRSLTLILELLLARTAALYRGVCTGGHMDEFVRLGSAGVTDDEARPGTGFPLSFATGDLDQTTLTRLKTGEMVFLLKSTSVLPEVVPPLLFIPVDDGKRMAILILSGVKQKCTRLKNGALMEIVRFLFLENLLLLEREGDPAGRPAPHIVTRNRRGSGRSRMGEIKFYHEDRLAALGVLAAGIAHELNQPLNTIRVVTEGLLFGREKGWQLELEELFENLEMISKQVIRMDKLIQNVRNFSRQDGAQGMQSVSFNTAIENVLSMIGRQIEAQGIHVKKTLDPDLPPLRSSLNELEQVIMNLIVNACQSLDESPRDNKVLSIRTETQDGTIQVEVSDNGIGIPDPLLEKIFDPFFTTKGVGKGTGLGLSISQSIVNQFGGRIEACRNDSGGATFLITAKVYRGSP